jgi:diguanylate cyclase (GGDEF)-like protein/putative nucleotidyltransferase with HDIG domain
MSQAAGDAIALEPPVEHGHVPSTLAANLPPRARAFFVAVCVAAVCATGPFLVKPASGRDWLAFLALGAAAALAQLFVVRTPRDQSYHTAIVFLVPAALILPPGLVALVALVQHIPEWLNVRYRWYIQTFNIANWTLALMGAWAAARGVEVSGITGHESLRTALAGAAAIVTVVAINHTLLATMLFLARGHSFRTSGLFAVENLSTDLVLAALGFAVAFAWLDNAWLIPFVLAPLVLIHRSLSVPALQAEARVDVKTGLYNARHFATVFGDELSRAERSGEPLSVIMADLDLLREINNTYGHLAGDAVLTGVADIFRRELRQHDLAARFGGEEFSILLPGTAIAEAIEIAERIRRIVAERPFEVETSSEPVHATISMGVASYPLDGVEASALIHQADLAVYRAKLQGRNRVLGAGSEPLAETPASRSSVIPLPRTLLAEPTGSPELSSPVTSAAAAGPAAQAPAESSAVARAPRTNARSGRPHAAPKPRLFAVSLRLGLFVLPVALLGVAAGSAGFAFGGSRDFVGLAAVVALVGVGQSLALEVAEGSISVSAVGALAGAALFGFRAALALAVASALVEWSARRSPVYQVVFNIGALSLASLAAAGIFVLVDQQGANPLATAGVGLAAGGIYFGVNTGLLAVAVAIEGGEHAWRTWRQGFAWLLPHYIVYGFVGGVMAIAYSAAGLYALAVFAVPLLLMRKTQEAYISHTRRNVEKLREAAVTIQRQNVSLEEANVLLRVRSTEAMESLSATVDARDAYTAGHSRRVRELALAIGRELDMSQDELDVLGHAALFHDIGKLAIPDAILLKPGRLTPDERRVMQGHSEEGARIIGRLGFLADAVPAIRHHHEHFNGGGYPAGLVGEEIPLGSRIIHVTDALDSMVTTRVYRGARTAEAALDELRQGTGSQFCPRCVAALLRLVTPESIAAAERGEAEYVIAC